MDETQASIPPQYFVEDGVHRAVAARENALRAILAILFEPGRSPRSAVVPIEDLHSPKKFVRRSDPRHDYDKLEADMATASGRAHMPPISLQPLGLPGQPASIPLEQVQILP